MITPEEWKELGLDEEELIIFLWLTRQAGKFQGKERGGGVNWSPRGVFKRLSPKIRGGALMIWAFVCEEIPGRPREISALFIGGSKTTRYRFSLFLLKFPVNG
jgi:hypothetical protein